MAEEEIIVDYDDVNPENNEDAKNPLPGASIQVKQ